MWGYILVGVAGFLAGAQNAVAGGGSFLTFPALLLAGLDPRAANINSTIALFPAQVTRGWASRGMAGGAVGLSLRTLGGIFAPPLLGGVMALIGPAGLVYGLAAVAVAGVAAIAAN